MSQVPDEMARYKQLLFLASKLPPMPAEDHTDDNKVKGKCNGSYGDSGFARMTVWVG